MERYGDGGEEADEAVTKERAFWIGPFQSDVLDLCRWIAAMLVVVEHLRSLIFVPYGAGGPAGLIAKAFYFLTGFGHCAVMVFFVMSGFLVGGKALDRLIAGEFSWQKYLIDRSSRLYAVYIVALALGGLLDTLGYHYANRAGLYDRTFSGSIALVNHNFHECVTPGIFGINMAMCQTILGPVFGSNGPLWSLANEFWYYVAGPLLFATIITRTWWKRVIGVAGLAGLFWFLTPSILFYGLVWLMGAGLFFVNGRRLLPMWVTGPVFLAVFSLVRLQWITGPLAGDFLIGLAFALVINSAVGGTRRLWWHNWSRRAADFSYSVYLCHVPFVVFVLSVIWQVGAFGLQERREPVFVALFAVVFGLAYGWSFAISLVTERQTPRIRQWLYRVYDRDVFVKTGTAREAGRGKIPD